ncbi:MAG: asparaginase [Chloroflexota bacterium]
MSVTRGEAVRIEVPDGAFAGDEPLVSVQRGDYTGSLHRGTLAVVGVTGEVRLEIGNVDQPVYLRSAAKPFQVMPALLAGAIRQFGIEQSELAVLCASHSAEPRHTEAVLSVLRKIGLDESALHCGIHPPLSEKTAKQRIRAGVEPSPVCNNCSGAHTGMLVACRASGWPVEGYGDAGHPVQIRIRSILAEFAGIATPEVAFATDNCHVPTFRLPVRNAAQAFARLGTGYGVRSELAAAAEQVVAAMTAFPEMVGGEKRFDSDLMRVARVTIVCKGGAEAFQGLAVPGEKLGMALKISDGASRAVAPVVMRVLEAIGALNEEQLRSLESYREPITRDLEGEIVGRLAPVFSIGMDA